MARGVIAVVVLLVAAVGARMALRGDSTADASASGSRGIESSVSTGDQVKAAKGATTTTTIDCTDADGQPVACLSDADEGKITGATVRDPIGWGAAQPTEMAATVQRGSTDTPLTPARRKLLGEQLEKARAIAERIGTVGNAKRLGYVQNNKEWLDGRGYEFVNWGNFQPTLDLDKPGVVVAAGTSDDDPIISIAYNVTRSREQGPPPDLPLEVMPWHFHHDLCRLGDQVIGNVELNPDGTLNAAGAKKCLEAGAVYEPQYDHWMIDLWVVPGWENPWGLVSSKHPDLFKVPQPWFPNGSAETHSH